VVNRFYTRTFWIGCLKIYRGAINPKKLETFSNVWFESLIIIATFASPNGIFVVNIPALGISKPNQSTPNIRFSNEAYIPTIE